MDLVEGGGAENDSFNWGFPYLGDRMGGFCFGAGMIHQPKFGDF